MQTCEAIGTEMAMSRNLRRQDTQSELTLAATKIAKFSKLTGAAALEQPGKFASRTNNGIQKISTNSSKQSCM